MIHREGRWISSMTAAEFTTAFFLLLQRIKVSTFNWTEVVKNENFCYLRECSCHSRRSHLSWGQRQSCSQRLECRSVWVTGEPRAPRHGMWLELESSSLRTHICCAFCHCLICRSRVKLKKKNWSQRWGRSCRFSVFPLQILIRVLLSHALCRWMKSHGWSFFPKQCFFTY